jgi:uncharacterized protein (TIGR00251 family)
VSPPASIIVHVVPRASATEVVGRHGDAIRIRLAAPPVDGAANAELVRFLAERLGVPRSAVSIARGMGGRRKTVAVTGLPTEAALRILLQTRR